MLDDLADAADVRSAGGGVGVYDAESEVGVEEGVHHHAVAELEDLEGEDGAGEEDQREREERELDDVVGLGGVSVVLLREGGGGAAQGVGPPPAQAAEARRSEEIIGGLGVVRGV